MKVKTVLILILLMVSIMIFAAEKLQIGVFAVANQPVNITNIPDVQAYYFSKGASECGK